METTLTKEQEDALIVAGESRLIMPYPGITQHAVTNLFSRGLLQHSPDYPDRKDVYLVTDAARELMQQVKRKVLSVTIPRQPPLILDDPHSWKGDFSGGILADELENAPYLESGATVFTVEVLALSLWTLATMGEWEPR